MRLRAPLEDGIPGLLCDEPPMSALLRSPPGSNNQLSRKRGGSDRTNLALAHEVTQRAKRLTDVRSIVRTMHLIEVDVVSAKPAQAVFDSSPYPPWRSAA